MKRLIIVLAAAALLGTFPTPGRSEEGAAAGNATTEELRTLQKLLEHQAKQLDTLTEQVTKLTQRLDAREGHEGHEPAPAPSTEPASEAPAPASPPPAAAPAPAPEPPRAEATGGGVKHLVAKGETLTSIAKHYNIPLADLQKANKSVNDRKLQIGQVLNIPSSANPEPAAPEKKENP